MRKKRVYLNNAAAMAIGAVLVGVGMSVAKAREDQAHQAIAVPAEQLVDSVRDVSALQTSSSVPSVSLAASTVLEKDPHIMSRKMLAGAALAGVLAAFFNLVGANRVLQFVADLGKSVAFGATGAIKAVAKAPVKVAQAAVKVTAETLAGPGKWMLMLGGLAIFAFTGVAHFDLQWQAGMALGAGLTVAATYGIGKTRQLTKNVTSSARQKFSRWSAQSPVPQSPVPMPV